MTVINGSFMVGGCETSDRPLSPSLQQVRYASGLLVLSKRHEDPMESNDAESYGNVSVSEDVVGAFAKPWKAVGFGGVVTLGVEKVGYPYSSESLVDENVAIVSSAVPLSVVGFPGGAVYGSGVALNTSDAPVNEGGHF